MIAEIIDGMPMPKLKRRGAPPKYPWLQMKPGQAFKFDPAVTFAGARSMASQMVGTAKVKFAVRETPTGIYCWRIDGTPYELQNGNYGQAVDPIDSYGETAEPAAQTVIMGYEKGSGLPMPPSGPSQSQLYADQINAEREANLARMGEKDPPIEIPDEDVI